MATTTIPDYNQQQTAKIKTNTEAINETRTRLGAFAPKIFDYTGAPLNTSRSTQGANNFVIIAKPADAANTPVGAENKIIVKDLAAAQDGDQVVYDADLIFINKANGDIMNWSEIKVNIKADKVMVIKQISAGTWELVKWEDKPAAPNSGWVEVPKPQGAEKFDIKASYRIVFRNTAIYPYEQTDHELQFVREHLIDFQGAKEMIKVTYSDGSFGTANGPYTDIGEHKLERKY